MSYNATGRLAKWQNKPISPTNTVNSLYGGSGQHVTMQSIVTTTASIGNIEEIKTSGSTTRTTMYYAMGGKRIAANVNGTFYHFGYYVLGKQLDRSSK